MEGVHKVQTKNVHKSYLEKCLWQIIFSISASPLPSLRFVRSPSKNRLNLLLIDVCGPLAAAFEFCSAEFLCSLSCTLRNLMAPITDSPIDYPDWKGNGKQIPKQEKQTY